MVTPRHNRGVKSLPGPVDTQKDEWAAPPVRTALAGPRPAGKASMYRSSITAQPVALTRGPARSQGRDGRRARERGFTLIEILIVVAITAILASVALPSYTAYIQRSKVPAGLDALQSYFTRMEQRFQDSGSYAAASACAIAMPTVQNFTVTCSISGGGTGYTATTTGSGPVAGYAYTINSTGTRATTAHPKGVPGSSCWSIKGTSCDA